MKLLKFKKRIEIEKAIGNVRIETFHYGSFDKKGKSKDWTELHCWYKCDCEHCPASWEDRGYESECYDYGCLLAKDAGDDAPRWIWMCMLPRWIKLLLIKLKYDESCLHQIAEFIRRHRKGEE